jgi:tRNA threonylcarbamoyl adenosine modification protein (Sua5/YciO/YrdC/YwlC family)
VAQYFKIHPVNPQGRLLRGAAEIIRAGGVVVYPTDTTYAIGCHIGDKSAVQRVRRIRQKDDKHNFAIICRDLSESGVYASYNTPVFRLLKANTPGPYTFILKATREVPRRLMHPKRKTIGLRVPDHRILQALLTELDEPMITSSLRLPGDEYPLNDLEEIRDRLGAHVDLIVDGGPCGLEPTTLVRLVDEVPEVIRRGKGDPSPFEY